MAGFRQIHPKIWKDSWFLELEPTQKLFFIYLFSNECACIAGLYELPKRVMAFESGLTYHEIDDAFVNFTENGKAYYEDGVVWIPNLRKYHETPSKHIQKNIIKDVKLVKNCPLKERYAEVYGIDRVSIGYREGIDTLHYSTLYYINGIEGESEGEIAPAVPEPQTADERKLVNHSATQAMLQAGFEFPGYGRLPVLIERLGPDPDPDTIKRARDMWLLSGFKPTNYNGIFDWYDNLLADPNWQPYKGRASPNGQSWQERADVFIDIVSKNYKWADAEKALNEANMLGHKEHMGNWGDIRRRTQRDLKFMFYEADKEVASEVRN